MQLLLDIITVQIAEELWQAPQWVQVYWPVLLG